MTRPAADRIVTGVVRAAHVLLHSAYCTAILIGTPVGYLGPGNIIRGDDSQWYEYAARHVPWDPIAARMAPLMPALYTMSGTNPRVLVVLQVAIAVVAWQWLARSASRLVAHRWLKVVLLVALLGVSLAPEVMIWNVAIGSEGVAMSVMAAVLAAAFRAVRMRTPGSWVVVASLVGLSMIARDTFVVVAGVVMLVAAWFAIRRADLRRHAIVAVAVCVLGVGASQWLANRGDPPRWYYPLQENIALRIMPDPNLTSWFADRGMPQIEQVREIGRNYYVGYMRLNEGPEFAPFRRWLRTEGQAAYIGVVVRHPKWVVETFVRDRDQWLEPDLTMYTSIPRATPGAVYGIVAAATFWRSPPLLVVLVMIAAVLVLAWRRRWLADDAQLRAVLATVWVTGMLHVVFSYVGDVLEVGRHTIVGATQVRVMVWCVLVLLVDRTLTARAGAASSDPTDAVQA